MPGQVIEGHAKFEENCERCHVRFDKAAQSQLCQDCHKDVAKDLQHKQGFHGRLKKIGECNTCHTEHKGRTAHIATFEKKSFNHTKTDFELKDAHAKVQCQRCHLPRVKYRHTPSACNACHKKDDKHRGTLGQACENCHTEQDWKKTKFDHSKTRFPLLGKHSDVSCELCHANQRFKDTPRHCYGCHKKDDYHKGVFGAKCKTCHSVKGWAITRFNHNKDTDFLLKGKHTKVKCESCHKTPVAKTKKRSTCIACHRGDDKHKGQFGRKCHTCHTEKNWEKHTFNHSRDTKFPLRGKHKGEKCESCHTGHLYKEPLQTTCYACHKKDDEHKGQFGEKCQTCHTEKKWASLIFDHNRDTKYPLRGKHQPVKCQSCHKGNLYSDKLNTSCYACHQQDDAHKGQEGEKCESCHNEKSWETVTFDHGLARFPLLGKHYDVPCKKCHVTQAFKDAPENCVACHKKEDIHKQQLGPQCDLCHNPRDWKLWDFDHNSRTKFVLDGAHDGLDCLACHTEPMGKTVSLISSCYSCHKHEDEHEGEFGRKCERCHLTSSFDEIKPDTPFSR